MGKNNLKRVLDKFIHYQLCESGRRTTSEVKLGLDPDPKKNLSSESPYTDIKASDWQFVVISNQKECLNSHRF